MFTFTSPQAIGTKEVLIENFLLISSLSKSLMVLPSVTFPSLLVIPPWLQPDWFCPSLHAQGARHFEFCLLCKLSCYYPPIQFILDLLKCLWVYSTKRFEVFQAFYSKYTSFLQVYRNMVYESAIFLLNCSFYTNNIDNARYQAEIFCHYHTIISAFSL